MFDVLKQQYECIRSTRQTLAAFLEEVPLQKLLSAVSELNGGSDRKTPTGTM